MPDNLDKLDDLASDVDDALVSADELKEENGSGESSEQIDRVKKSLEKAKATIDEMEDAHD